jgi:RimJ/RimL family protein N-acetyltransferase
VLRPFAAGDAERAVEIKSNWKVARMLRMAPYPPNLGDEAAWIASHAQEWRQGTAYRFAITIGGRVIGCADVDSIEGETGDLGYWLDEDWWGRGVAGEAARAVMTFAADQVGLRRLTSGHAADNPASGRVLRKLGFARTGELSLWSLPRACSITQVTYVLDLQTRTAHKRARHP